MATISSASGWFSMDSGKPRSKGGDGNYARGLKNLGNTCFLNSVLQAITSCSGFVSHVNYLSQQKGVGQFTKCLASCLAELRSTSDNTAAVNPKALFDLLVKSNPDFRGHNEQDALEVFDCMMSCLSEENAELCTELRRKRLSEQLNLSHSLVPTPLNTAPQQARSASPLANPFRGLLCSQIECQACNTAWGGGSHRWTPVRHQIFTTLPLPMPTASSLLRQHSTAGSGSSSGSAHGLRMHSRELSTPGKLTLEACLGEFLFAESLSEVSCSSCSIVSTITAVQARERLLLGKALKTPTHVSPPVALCESKKASLQQKEVAATTSVSMEREKRGLNALVSNLQAGRVIGAKDSYVHDIDLVFTADAVEKAAQKALRANSAADAGEGSDLEKSRSTSECSGGSPTSIAEVEALTGRSSGADKAAAKGCTVVVKECTSAVAHEEVQEEVQEEVVGEDVEEMDDTVQRLQEMFLSLRQQIRTDAVKRSSISRLPPLLCLYLCRRVYDERTGRMRKRDDHVAFPLVLSMASSFSPDTRMQVAAKPASLLPSSVLSGALRGDGFGRYALRAVVEHRGNADTGHYVAYCLVDAQRRRWELCSDERHAEVKERDVLNAQAAMLFYEKMAI